MKKKKAKRTQRKFPFAQMLVGESVLITTGMESARISAHRISARTGARFTYRTESGGFRFWRIG